MECTAYCHPETDALNRKAGWFTKTMLAMKLTGILLLATILQVSARSTAQTVTYEAKSTPLSQVFAALEKQTGCVFFYDKQDLQRASPVTVNLQGVPLKSALEAILADQPLAFNIQGNTIAITRREKAAAPVPIIATPPPHEVEGNVMDESGEPLAGATVKLKNGKIAAITDEKGRFILKNISDDATIEITYTGYAPQTVKIGNQISFKVSLSRATNKLDEMQVIAYGTTTKRLNTGDVITVTSKEIEQQPVSNPLAALEGRVPGLVVTQNTGIPGGSFTVQIRGQNSLINGNDPFYVIDGVPYYSQIPGSNQGYGPLNVALHGGSPLNFINPYDIESIEVLKDADATAIYGSRAANGAILITTKKGKIGTTRFNVNVYSGIGKPTRKVGLLNTRQYLAMRHEAFTNDGKAPGPSDHDLNGDWDSTRYTDWQKVLIGNQAHYDDAQASFSGGNSNTQYLISGGYHRETTPFPTLLSGSGADQKASMHFNIYNISPNRKFKIRFTGSYLFDKNTTQSNDLTYTALSLSPLAPAVYNPDGSLNWVPTTPGGLGTWGNPLAQFLEGYKSLSSNLIANAFPSYTILPGLELKASVGYTNTQTNETQTIPTTRFDPGLHVTSGSSNFNAINNKSWIVEPQAEYNLQLGRGKFAVLLGTSFHENNTSVQNLSATGFSSDALLENIQAASSVSVRYSNSTLYKYNAFFGRINYNWQDKYILNITARHDGSSRFGPGKQFANFGAIGAGWVFSREHFIQQHLSFISFGKIRASYGTAGNDQIGDYRFLDLYGPTQYPYQGIQALYPANLFNADLSWEVNKKLEGGLELGFLKDRITISASYFRNRSGNQLVTSPVSAVTGFGSIPANLPALVENSGQEYVMNTINVRTKNFNWTSSFNLTIARNKLISFPNLATSAYSQRFVIGQPITILRIIREIGVNDTSGIYQFADFKGNSTYNPNLSTDRTILINTTPKFYGGFSNSFSYKGFSLDVLFQFVKQTGQNFFGAYSNMPGTMANQRLAVLNRWEKPGDINPYQKFSQDNSGSAYNSFRYAQAYSNLSYGDASFIRLKNLALSWQMDARLKQKLHLQDFRIYLQGQNLLTITNYSGIDPETQGGALPPLRVYTLGFQIGL